MRDLGEVCMAALGDDEWQNIQKRFSFSEEKPTNDFTHYSAEEAEVYERRFSDGTVTRSILWKI